MLNDEVRDWLEQINPFLYLSDFSKEGELQEPKELKVLDQTEALIIEGVDHFNFSKALDSRLILIVEDDLSKMASFLKTLTPHKNLYLSTSSKDQLFPLLKRFLFKKIQFEGRLQKISSYIDGMQMSYSEYRDLGEKVLPNILSNLLHTKSYIDGRECENLFKGEEVIVCGSGLSLKPAISQIKKMQNRPIIISVGSSLPVLVQEGIIPDFFAFIDPDPPTKIYDCLKALSIPTFYQNRASRDLLSLISGPSIFMGSSKGWQIEEALLSQLGRESFFFDAGCHAGNFGVHIASALGASKVVLAGLDGVAKEGEEVHLSRNGKSTRLDLFYGMDFFKELQSAFPKTIYEHFTLGFSFDESLKISSLNVKGKTKDLTLPKEKKVDQGEVKKLIDLYFDHSMLQSLEQLFKEEDYQKQKAWILALLAEFSLQPFYLHFISPLWTLWKDLMEDDALSEITFIYRILKLYESKTGFVGSSFYLFGQKEGEERRFDDKGTLREEVYYFRGKRQGAAKYFDEGGNLSLLQEYDDGKRDGDHKVYQDGELKRKGSFVRDLPHGLFLTYQNGKVIDQMEFDRGQKCGTHKIYSDTGVKLEEVIYHDKIFYDKRLFDDEGILTYEAVWKDGQFSERGFEDRKVKWAREGKLIGEELVLREDK